MGPARPVDETDALGRDRNGINTLTGTEARSEAIGG